MHFLNFKVLVDQAKPDLRGKQTVGLLKTSVGKQTVVPLSLPIGVFFFLLLPTDLSGGSGNPFFVMRDAWRYRNFQLIARNKQVIQLTILN